LSLIADLVSKVESHHAPADASERQDAQSANNPTQESGKLSQCGDGGDDEKCVSETRDRMSNGGDSGGLPDASERQDAQSANNPTQESGEFSQCGDDGDDKKCVSETRDMKAIIRQVVEQHELPALGAPLATLQPTMMRPPNVNPAGCVAFFLCRIEKNMYLCRVKSTGRPRPPEAKTLKNKTQQQETEKKRIITTT